MKRLAVLAVLSTGMFMAASAQAAPGDAARNADRVARHKFAQVTPDTAYTWGSRCRWESGWTYWHCQTRVDGKAGYHGEFRVLVNRESLRAYVRGLVVTT